MRKAAEQGHPKAQFELGAAYRRGRGVTRDPVEAMKWWMLSSQHGGISAMIMAPELAGELKPEQFDEAWERTKQWRVAHGLPERPNRKRPRVMHSIETKRLPVQEEGGARRRRAAGSSSGRARRGRRAARGRRLALRRIVGLEIAEVAKGAARLLVDGAPVASWTRRRQRVQERLEVALHTAHRPRVQRGEVLLLVRVGGQVERAAVGPCCSRVA